MFIFSALAPEIEALSLRAKVSHSWLDHEILLVTPDAAALRWEMNEWQRRLPFESLRGMAWELAGKMMQFSASSLVDRLTPFSSIPHAELEVVKERLDALHLRKFDVQEIEREYKSNLVALEAAVDSFASFINSEAPTEASVRRGWTQVRERAAALKVLFASGRIPDGIVLP